MLMLFINVLLNRCRHMLFSEIISLIFHTFVHISIFSNFIRMYLYIAFFISFFSSSYLFGSIKKQAIKCQLKDI